ncbi:MAG: DUF3592 domain-containing protein [Ardenticatenia bacterium]|nr:MAG: DUF3592 domain-containing protein [Ardenticatenia bacterium]
MTQRAVFWRAIHWDGLLFAGLLFLFNAYFTFALVRSYRAQVRAHNSFEPISATVLESKVQRVSGDRGSDSFHPYVRYIYEVAGTQYESDTFSFLGTGYNDYTAAQRALENYHPGAIITVYYDPTSPEISVVDNSLPAGIMPLLLIAGLALFWSANAAALLYALWPVIKRNNPLNARNNRTL